MPVKIWMLCFNDFLQNIKRLLPKDQKVPTEMSPSFYFFFPETCRDVFCPGSSTCVVDQTNNAYCVTCNRICPEPSSSEQYLCGNDGVTYSSACHLRKATCLLGRSIGLAYEGKCISRYSGLKKEKRREREKKSVVIAWGSSMSKSKSSVWMKTV